MAGLAYCYLVFSLYLHACTARLLIVPDKESVAHLRFSRKAKVGLESSNRMGSARGQNIVQLDDHTIISIRQEGEYQGETTKGLRSSMILDEATVTKDLNLRYRISSLHLPIPERLMLASNVEESVSGSKNEETVEDIVVMDYAQPHRKPPIHNKGT